MSEIPHEPPTLADGSGAASAPRAFGNYELLREIARGGMGVIYEARQKSLDRLVALKMILAGEFASPADVERFRIEARAAAGLEHPGIVAVYEVGEHDGRHFFTMQLIDGTSLAHKVPELTREPRQAATLVAQVARAVHFAHQRGVLHRDLKPANILVDRGGQPHVTDFGLAKRLDGGAGLTQTGAVVGTPCYLAPEQAAGKKGLTPAADVYGLGAVLYECLTGRPPFRAETPLDTLLQVLEREPVPPRRLNPAVGRDLETVCLKCLHKDAARRYPSAEALAEDLERWLRGEPVRARPVSAAERVWKWARRRPERALLGILTAFALLWGLTWAARQGLDHLERVQAEARERQTQEENQARRQWREGQQQLDRVRRALKDGLTACAGGRVDEGMLTWAHGLRLATEAGDPDLQQQLRVSLGRWRWRLPRLLALVPAGRGSGNIGQLPLYKTQAIAFSADGGRLALTGGFVGLTVWDLTTARPLFETPTDIVLPNRAVALHPDGQVVVAAGRFWDATTGKPLAALPGAGSELAQFSPDGKRLLTSQPIQLWDAAAAKPVGRPLPHGFLTALAFSRDGRLLVTAGRGRDGNGREFNDVRLWDTATGAARGEPLPQADVQALTFSPDGKRLAAGAWGGTRLWDVGKGKADGEVLSQHGHVQAVAFSPDGQVLLTASNGPRLWDVATGKPRTAELDSPGGIPFLAAFDPDGKTFATATVAGVYQWETATGRLLGGVAHPQEAGTPHAWSFSPNHRHFAVIINRLVTKFNTDEPDQVTGTIQSSILTGVAWEFPPTPLVGVEKDAPIAGSVEYITLWLQVWTGRGYRDEQRSFYNLPPDVWQDRRRRLDELGGRPPP
jgi:WD40 repeat protein